VGGNYVAPNQKGPHPVLLRQGFESPYSGSVRGKRGGKRKGEDKRTDSPMWHTTTAIRCAVANGQDEKRKKEGDGSD